MKNLSNRGKDDLEGPAARCRTRGGRRKGAGKILEIIREPVSLEGGTVQVTASIGAAFLPRDGSDEKTLIKKADRAMYRAKEEGKNRSALSVQDLVSNEQGSLGHLN